MQNGFTPLHKAAWKGHQTVVTALIAAGADVNAKNNVRRCPLRVAVLPAGCRMHLQSLSRDSPLFSLSRRCLCWMQYGDTPLILAAKQGHQAVVDLLKAAGGHR